MTPRTEALWTDPAPRTPEGRRLWGLFRDGKLGPSPFGIRDFGQRICQIEAEAVAARNAELAEKVRGLAMMQGGQIVTIYGYMREPRTPADWVELFRVAVLDLLEPTP